ncbi:hypothetical protein ACFWEJ_10615 [Promicromonospora sp. NPDC060204]|uniref:hypothetical protein n=1 Tax=Promicromonospora sp. NPDC060204 TaxID=3347071 RepID=UPI00365CC601
MTGPAAGPATGPATGPAAGPEATPTDTWAFLLPPGWARFPLGEGRGKELGAAVDEVVARTLPGEGALAGGPQDDDVVARRELLRASLRAALAGAGTGTDAEAGTSPGGSASTGAVYLPTVPIAGIAVPASITETELFGEVGRSPAEVAERVLGRTHDTCESVDLDGRPGARVVRTGHDVHREGGRPARSTREVTYVVSRDEAAGAWLVLTFSTGWSSRDTERLAATLVEFFDAVMTTFRWTGPGSNPVNLPERRVPGSA